MPFNFCPKRDASFWENGSELKRFVLELQTGGFADYTYQFVFSDFDFISGAKIEDFHGMSYLHFFMRDNQK